MDISAEAVVSSLLASSIGFALFRYGKREQRLPQLVAGLVLMIGPYIAGGALETCLLSAIVGVGLVCCVRAGW